MKKSDKSFSVEVHNAGASSTTEVGTRSGAANFLRNLLGDAEAGKDIKITIHVKAVEATTASVTAE